MTKVGKRYHGVHRYLVAPGRRWAMDSAQLRAWLGLPSRLPANYATAVSKGGLDFEVRAKQRRGMEKRVFVKCPECAEPKWLEAGHLHQHVEAVH